MSVRAGSVGPAVAHRELLYACEFTPLSLRARDDPVARRLRRSVPVALSDPQAVPAGPAGRPEPADQPFPAAEAIESGQVIEIELAGRHHRQKRVREERV